jgi:hypothetical protein
MCLENDMRLDDSVALSAIFGVLEDFKRVQMASAKMLEPFLRSCAENNGAILRQLEPIIRLTQSEQCQSIIRDFANKRDWITDCTLGAHTRSSVEPRQRPKPILGFSGGISKPTN